MRQFIPLVKKTGKTSFILQEDSLFGGVASDYPHW